MEFIGYCNGATNKDECAAAYRDNLYKFTLPVKKNGWISLGKTWKKKMLYEGKCLTVIDFDVKKGESFSVDNLPGLCYSTMLVRTGGGGIHAYFLIKDDVIKMQHFLEDRMKFPELKGIDIQSEGGIVFAPGSKFTNHNNNPYRLLEHEPPLTITKAQFNLLLSDLLLPKEVENEKAKKNKLDFTGIRQGFIDIILGSYIVPHIKDNKTDMDEFVIWKAFYREVHASNLSINDVFQFWADNPNTQPEFNLKTARYQISMIKTDILNKRPKKETYFKIFPQYKKDDDIKWYYRFESYWDENFAGNMLWITEWNNWVRYNNGIFEKIDNLEFNKILFDWLDIKEIHSSTQKVNLAKTRIISNQYVTLDMFDADSNIRNVRNGLLQLSTLTIIPHTPTYLSLYQASVNYLEPTELLPTPCWDEMRVKYPVEIQKVEWFVRNIIYNDMSNEVGMFIVGVNRSGKGSTIGLISAMFSGNLTSYQSLESLANNFGLSPLVSKNLNLDSEGTITRLKALAVKYYKTIVGRDGRITVNSKNKQQFDYEFNPFFFIAAMNQLYKLPPTDVAAFFARCFIIIFSKRELKPDPTFKGRLRLEADSVFSKLAQTGTEPLSEFYERVWGIPFVLDEYCNEMKNIWESWSSSIEIVCNSIFIKDEGVNRLPVEEVVETVKEELTDKGYPIPKEHTIKSQITVALKKMKIYKQKSGDINYYRPIRYIDSIEAQIIQRTLTEVID